MFLVMADAAPSSFRETGLKFGAHALRKAFHVLHERIKVLPGAKAME